MTTTNGGHKLFVHDEFSERTGNEPTCSETCENFYRIIAQLDTYSYLTHQYNRKILTIMAEIVEYRVEKTRGEIELLVEFGIFTKEAAKEILAKRENFEYTLRRRTKSKLDHLKYIRFEINMLDAIEKYKKQVIRDYEKHKKETGEEDLDRKILMLQAKKLNNVVRSRCAHISSLFRKLTTGFQFDKKLWLAYIDFAKSRKWNSRVTALYWRLLRVSGDDPDLWLAATQHEIEANKAYNTARGLFVRALRHHPISKKICSAYLKMETDLGTEDIDSLRELAEKMIQEEDKQQQTEVETRNKPRSKSCMDRIYECYDSRGLDETRNYFKELEGSVQNRKLSLYVAMIQVETWQVAKVKSQEQLNRIRSIYDKALMKFGESKPKLWYEYIHFEHEHAKNLNDFERINQLYSRAQATLHPSKVDRVIQKYTLLQANPSKKDIEYSDYSDLDD